MELQKPSVWSRLKRFVHEHKKLVIISAVALILVGGGVVAFIITSQKKPVQHQANSKPKEETTQPPPPPKKYYSPLSGVEVADEAATKQQVRAVIIENSPDARPQSSLKYAGVVFEAIAEGGITRFLCLYQENHPALIGPVRSLRPYYNDWLAPFDASVSHVGGSFNALKEIRNGSFKDIDQFFNGAYYWRATDRYAPHNVYTSSAKLNELNLKKGYTSSNFTGFPRKPDTPVDVPVASKIDVNISYGLFNVHYDYDKPTNTYVRSEGGKPHLDRELGQLQPKTVIVIKVPMVLGFEDGYREQMTTLGSGGAYVFQDGRVIEGTWTKADKRHQIVFKDASGNVIPLNPGQTWISVISPEKSVTWQ